MAPAVDELALMLALGVVQFNINAEPGVTFGGVVLLVTVTFVVFVHPFEGSVTTTVYVPAVFMVGLEVVAPAVIPAPLHE